MNVPFLGVDGRTAEEIVMSGSGVGRQDIERNLSRLEGHEEDTGAVVFGEGAD
jgi:hypothetical protein